MEGCFQRSKGRFVHLEKGERNSTAKDALQLFESSQIKTSKT